jgi:hypothetical protein
MKEAGNFPSASCGLISLSNGVKVLRATFYMKREEERKEKHVRHI